MCGCVQDVFETRPVWLEFHLIHARTKCRCKSEKLILRASAIHVRLKGGQYVSIVGIHDSFDYRLQRASIVGDQFKRKSDVIKRNTEGQGEWQNIHEPRLHFDAQALCKLRVRAMHQRFYRSAVLLDK